MNEQYTLTLRTRMVSVRVELNDVPRWSRPGREADHISSAVNPWIVPGRNTLRLAIDWPADLDYQPGRASVELRIESRPADRPTATPKVIVECVWPGAAPESYPAFEVLEFDVAQAPPSRLWSDAGPIELTPSAQLEIRGLTREVHAALSSGDVDRAAALLDFRTVDVGQSTFTPPDESRRGQRDALIQLLTPESGNRVEELHPQTLELHPVAGGKLIWVTGPDRAPAITIETEAGTTGFSLFMTKLKDTWTIVR